MENEEKPHEEQQLVTDFSTLFKTKAQKPFKPNKNRENVKNWLLEIPTKLSITVEELKERKVLDIRRWMSISRPQYPSSCGISSLVSVWNYLFSKIGVGKLEPLSTEKGIVLLGIAKEGDDLKDVNFGGFTGNQTLIQWFKILCKQFGVEGDAKIIIKFSGKGALETTPDQGLESLKSGLSSDSKGYIYHCENHYFCPIGYQVTPGHPLQAYKPLKDIKLQDTQTWIIIGETSKCHPVFHTRKWEEIVLDLSTKWPDFYDIRQPGKGVQRRKSANEQNEGENKGTINCIIEFSRVE